MRGVRGGGRPNGGKTELVDDDEADGAYGVVSGHCYKRRCTPHTALPASQRRRDAPKRCSGSKRNGGRKPRGHWPKPCCEMHRAGFHDWEQFIYGGARASHGGTRRFRTWAPSSRKRRRRHMLGENGSPALCDEGLDPRLALYNKLVRDVPAAVNLWAMVKRAVADAWERRDASALADVFVLVLQTRDVRGGKGERALTFHMLLQLYPEFPLTVTRLVALLPEYGCWKDLLLLLKLADKSLKKQGKSAKAKARAAAVASMPQAQPPVPPVGTAPPATSTPARVPLVELRGVLLSTFVERLRADAALATGGKQSQVSLAAKWAPREGRKVSAVARELAALMFPDTADGAAACAQYRRLVASLNRTLGVAEVHMAGGEWAAIDPGAVSARCLKIKRHALANERLALLPQRGFRGGSSRGRAENPRAGQTRFPRNSDRVACAQRLAAHLAAAEQDESVKGVHGAALHPHELVREHLGAYGGAAAQQSEDRVLEAQWRDLRGKFLENSGALGKLVPLVDVSGSMHGIPMEVAIALGILLSEVTHPALRHRFITFESEPSWHVLDGAASLRAKVLSAQAAPWGGSTNFEAAIDLILRAAVAAQLPPDAFDGLTLVVFSDMQFDCARGGYSYGAAPADGAWATQHERLVSAFAEAGRASAAGVPYPAPHVIYWNLRGGARTHAAGDDTPGVSLLSGFSPSMLKLFLEGRIEELADPLRTMRAVLGAPRYDAVRAACAEAGEGLLSGYSPARQHQVPVEAAAAEQQCSAGGGECGAG